MKMKRLLLLLGIIIGSMLTACTPAEEPYVVDCAKYPTHADCIEDEEPLVCEDGYIEDNGACVLEDNNVDDFLEIYYINDFHGALTASSDQIGIAYIANLVNTRRSEHPNNVLFLAGGDILQGSALSNYYYGRSTVNLLNLMELDAFTIGNHEFDWGLETILDYADGIADNGEASFPFLGANIFHKDTADIPQGIDPFTIIERGGHRIGIIGTMGYGLERSIAESRIAPYEFADPIPIIKSYTEHLRTEENCDVILVVAHDSGYINQELSELEGDFKVDAIFNGHSHNEYANLLNGIPEMQSGGNGEYVGYVRINFYDGQIVSYQIDNLNKYQDPLLYEEDIAVAALLETYVLETDGLFNDPIITSDDYYSSYQLTDWIAGLIRQATGADIAFHNFGGTRTSIGDGEVITLALLYEIWPFDNVIKTVELTGREINTLIATNSLGYVSAVETFEPDTLYLVATNDYVFDKPDNPFLEGVNPTNTGLLLRDLAQAELELQATVYDLFRIDNELLTDAPVAPATSPRYKNDESQ